MNYAGFWRRSIAASLDTIVFFGVYALLEAFTNLSFTNVNAIYYCIMTCYYILMTTSKYQATLGQMIMNIKVGDIARYKLSLAQSSLRYILFILPALPIMFYTIHPSADQMMATFEQLENVPPEELESYIMSSETMDEMSRFFMMFFATCILSLVWFLPIAFTKEKTGLHDLISKQRAFNMSEQ